MRNRPPLSTCAPVEVARHDGEPSALASEWAALVDPRHPGAAFRSAAWLSTWWKINSPKGEPLVLVARERGRTIGILPLYAERTGLGGRRLRLMGDGIVGSDYLGAAAQPDEAPRVCGAFARWLAAAAVDELDLDGLFDDDPLVSALRAATAGRAAVTPRYLCPHVRFAGSFDAYLDGLPDGIGQQWRRRRRWLEKRPGYRLDVLSSPAEVALGIDVLLALHRRRWAQEGGSDAIDGPRLEAFHREAARRLAGLGWAQVFVLHVEGAPRAALYGFRHGDRFAFYQAGLDPDWRARSVGTVLLGQVIQRCFVEGLSEFDFLRGSEPYKLRWATGWRETVRLGVRNDGLRPWLSHQSHRVWLRLRAAGKRALPSEAWEWARRTRRRALALTGGSR
jgi:CelD/BcsL family acetyltransferase involved in cellulose biosynthesis